MADKSIENKDCIVVVPAVDRDINTALMQTGLRKRMAELIKAGYDVQILFAHTEFSTVATVCISGVALQVTPLQESKPVPSAGPMSSCMRDCRCVYDQLTQQPRPTMLLGSNQDGLLFYVLNAQHLGIDFQSTHIEVMVGEPLAHRLKAEGEFSEDYQTSLLCWLERSVVERANSVSIHTPYLKEWCASAGYELPPAQTTSASVGLDQLEYTNRVQQTSIQELVFCRRAYARQWIVALYQGTGTHTHVRPGLPCVSPALRRLRRRLKQSLKHS